MLVCLGGLLDGTVKRGYLNGNSQAFSSGASQFAAVGVIASGGVAASAIVTAGLLGTRNALYAIQMSPLLGVKGVRRILAAESQNGRGWS